jgi:uncharacterized membrane protein YbhN (UPF0104 family)
VRTVANGNSEAGLLGHFDLTGWPSRRGYALGAGLLLAGGVAMAATRIGRGAFDSATASLSHARPGWLLVAAAAFAIGLLCSSAAWRTGLRSCGGTAGFAQVSARYAVGSLVNAFSPAHLGGAVRLGLLAQTLDGKERVWRAGGVAGAISLARSLALAALVVAAAAWGRIPLWPAPILIGVVVVAVVICARLSSRARGHIGSLLEVFRTIRRCPSTASTLFGWVTLAFVARVAGAAAIAIALGTPGPVWVALVLVTAMALSGLLPLTPGNFGAGAGAVALALHGTGVGLGAAMAIGVSFQAVETFVGVTLGLAGVAALAKPASRTRRWSLAVVGTAGIIVLAALGAAASIDLI